MVFWPGGFGGWGLQLGDSFFEAVYSLFRLFCRRNSSGCHAPGLISFSLEFCHVFVYFAEVLLILFYAVADKFFDGHGWGWGGVVDWGGFRVIIIRGEHQPEQPLFVFLLRIRLPSSFPLQPLVQVVSGSWLLLLLELAEAIFRARPQWVGKEQEKV